MKRVRIILLIGFLFVFKISKAQQDAQFSQYIFNGLYINPAYAGYKEDIFVNSFYRSQWTGFQGAPTTESVAIDGALTNTKVGLGLLLDQDKIGAQSTTAMYANYAYRLPLGEEDNSVLAFGLGFGFVQNSINGNLLVSTDANDNYVPTGNQSVIVPDARLGVLYTSDSFFAGASVDNLLASHIHTSAQNALTPLPKPHIYVTVGALFDLAEDIKFKPSLLIRDSQGAPKSTDINAFILFNDRLWLGATYRTSIGTFNNTDGSDNLQSSDALVGMVEFYINPRFRVGYAFDYSLNAIGNYGYGSHELSVSFLIKRNKSSGEPKDYSF